MDHIYRFFPVLTLLLLLTSGCFHEGAWDNCPEFEVRKATFRTEKKLHPNMGRPSSCYLMRWNILGPVTPAGSDLSIPDMEGEETLCGFVNAPYPAMWRVKHFPLEKEKNPLFAKEADFTSLYKDVKKESVFYLCATLDHSSWEKEVLIHTASSGKLTVYWNGKKVCSSKKALLPEKEEKTAVLLLRGKNRLVLKYRDGKAGNKKRAVSFRMTLPKEGKSALIR